MHSQRTGLDEGRVSGVRQRLDDREVPECAVPCADLDLVSRARDDLRRVCAGGMNQQARAGISLSLGDR